ncbi:MAG: aminotransferase DegT [Spirochaetes bacterium]|nr:MAG: aminotransferase DegT [Spirochaetota bacterium]
MQISWAVPNVTKKDLQAVYRVLKSNWFSMGKEVKTFEKKMTSYLSIKHAIATNNGTSALDVSLKCIGISNGDEVIIPALTYIATGNAVLYNNAIPVFVDVDDTLNINPELIEEKITERTKAIINIDFGGNASNYRELQRISRRYNIHLIVDGAHSLGAEYHSVKCCTHGIVNTTSFHAAKILTTIEGGMVFTNSKEIYEKARAIRNQGETSKYYHTYLGNNYRMTDILAALGNSQLDRFEETLKQRRQRVVYYKEHLKNVDYPRELPGTVNSNFLFPILVENRDKLNRYLNKNGIETRITYPTPINEQPIFRKFSKETFPMAKQISRRIIALPLHTKLTREEQDYIIKIINKFGG